MDVKDYQMWKISGSSIVSQFNQGTMGIYEGNIFKNDGISAFIGDDQGKAVTRAVSIETISTSNYEFSLTGKAIDLQADLLTDVFFMYCRGTITNLYSFYYRSV